MAFQIADVVADAADAELAEVGEVLADLRGIQMKLFRQRLRRDGPHAGIVERVQAAQVHRQAIGGELGDLIGALFYRHGPDRPFVQCFHKHRRLYQKRPGVPCRSDQDRRSGKIGIECLRECSPS